jgi:hypothetical protein
MMKTWLVVHLLVLDTLSARGFGRVAIVRNVRQVILILVYLLEAFPGVTSFHYCLIHKKKPKMNPKSCLAHHSKPGFF